jgi:hypothetical protein
MTKTGYFNNGANVPPVSPPSNPINGSLKYSYPGQASFVNSYFHLELDYVPFALNTPAAWAECQTPAGKTKPTAPPVWVLRGRGLTDSDGNITVEKEQSGFNGEYF